MICIDMWDYVGMIHNGIYYVYIYMEIKSMNQIYMGWLIPAR